MIRNSTRTVGKNLFVPKVDAALPGGMDLLRIYDDEDLCSLPSGVWGIKEPTFQYRDAPRVKGLYPPFICRSTSTSAFTDGNGDGRGAARQQRRTGIVIHSTSFYSQVSHVH